MSKGKFNKSVEQRDFERTMARYERVEQRLLWVVYILLIGLGLIILAYFVPYIF